MKAQWSTFGIHHFIIIICMEWNVDKRTRILTIILTILICKRLLDLLFHLRTIFVLSIRDNKLIMAKSTEKFIKILRESVLYITQQMSNSILIGSSPQYF